MCTVYSMYSPSLEDPGWEVHAIHCAHVLAVLCPYSAPRMCQGGEYTLYTVHMYSQSDLLAGLHLGAHPHKPGTQSLGICVKLAA